MTAGDAKAQRKAELFAKYIARGSRGRPRRARCQEPVEKPMSGRACCGKRQRDVTTLARV